MVSIALILTVLGISKEAWNSIPKSKKDQIKKQISKGSIGLAKKTARTALQVVRKKKGRKKGNPHSKKKKRKTKTKSKRMHCREKDCKWSVSMSLPFKERMAKLRKHRKKKHPKAHKKSVRKALRTKREKGIINKKGGKNPCPRK